MLRNSKEFRIYQEKTSVGASSSGVVESEPMSNVQGEISVAARGFGFVSDPDSDEDIFIPRSKINGAVNGDRVEVEITGEREKGPEGRVVAILKRARSEIGGTILTTHPDPISTAPALGPDVRVLVKTKKKLRVGDRVHLHVDHWGEEIEASLLKVIGHIDHPKDDTPCAIIEYGLRDQHPKEAIDEARAFSEKMEVKDRVDLRSLETITIDPRTAKDFDDALSLEKKGNHYILHVHIADVTHYVKKGSALDVEAKKRCNSTYFPGTCVPMLPEQLSNNLCSLKPNVDRLAATVKMEFDEEGELVDYEIFRSVIHSDRRYTYEEAFEVLDSTPLLKLMKELCLLLKHQRSERGSIEFSLPEVALELDENEMPTGTRFIEYDITHQMVEEFMLKANEVVATHLTNEGSPIAYRVHEMPFEEDLTGFYDLASALGFKLPQNPTLHDLQVLFDKAYKTPFGPQLAVSFIRSLRMATYSAENIGHYGLSLEHYCHFTSPIRRYPDLLVHRILFGDKVDEEEVEAIAAECSDKERNSGRAESDVRRLKKLRYLNAVEESQWEAVVSGIKPFGIAFQLNQLLMEGFLHVSDLATDYYTYDRRKGKLVGRSTGHSYGIGDAITIQVGEINLITRDAKWHMIEPELHVKRRPTRGRRRR